MSLYAAPDTLDFAAKVRRSLRDANVAVFESAQIVDFINAGLSELSLIRPLETTVEIVDANGLEGISADPLATTISDLDYIWAVEMVGLDKYVGSLQTLSPDDPGTNWRNGWDFVGGTLVLPVSLATTLSDVWAEAVPLWSLRVRGYRHRRRIDDPNTDVLDLFSLPEEQACVSVAQEEGFNALLSDRSLFQQWQTATNNTDVSPTQLQGMAQSAHQKWKDARKHLSLIRRPLLGAQ